MASETLNLLWKCVRGPALYRIHGEMNADGIRLGGKDYSKNGLESTSEFVLGLASFLYSLSYGLSPFLIPYMYRGGYFTMEGVYVLLRASVYVITLLGPAYCIRGIGRFNNESYRLFIHDLSRYERSNISSTTTTTTTTSSNTKKLVNKITQYDFQFSRWPVNFNVNQLTGDDKKPPPQLPASSTAVEHTSLMDRLTYLPLDILAYLVFSSVGKYMVYPGAIGLIQSAMFPMLISGRAKLIETDKGVRGKVRTIDNNDIDTMFIDNRKTGELTGQKLVICCEGNAAFYEVGCISTPQGRGYSVLGWNHPGFAGSTGFPYPSQERNAADSVFQYAVTRLGFRREDVILFCWSIGGYPVAWLAQQYPDVHAVIVDASFDDILPLALSKMPLLIRSVIERTIRNHMNLNIAELLGHYHGPLLLIKRTNDEVITTMGPEYPDSNRINDLLIQILQYRYPILMDDALVIETLLTWLSSCDTSDHNALLQSNEVDADECLESLRAYVRINSRDFPLLVGETLSSEQKTRLVLFLVVQYLTHFNGTHCTPFPSSLFRMPWSL